MSAPKDQWPGVISMAYEYYEPDQRGFFLEAATTELGPVPEKYVDQVNEMLKSKKPKTFQGEPE